MYHPPGFFNPSTNTTELMRLYSRMEVLKNEISEKNVYIQKIKLSLKILSGNPLSREELESVDISAMEVSKENIDLIRNTALAHLKSKDPTSYLFYTSMIMGIGKSFSCHSDTDFIQKKVQLIEIYEDLGKIALKEHEKLETQRLDLEELINNEAQFVSRSTSLNLF